MSAQAIFYNLQQKPGFIAGGVFALALLLRLIFVWQWHATPYGATPLLDAQAYDLWAQDIVKGHWLRERAFYQLPLYPYALALLYGLFGHSLWVGSVFNAIVGAAGCALLTEISFICFGSLAAITTGILSALYAPALFYTGPTMKEPLGLFLLAACVLFACRAFQANNWRMYLASGLALGLCALIRGNVLALAPALPLILWVGTPSSFFKKSGVFFLGIALAILPVTLHNIIVSHDFVLISYADGFNATIGHGPMATGTSYLFPPGVTSNPAREEYDVTRIAASATGNPSITPSQVSSYWRGLAIDYALSHPAHEFRLLIDKIAAFWNNAEPFDNYDMRFIEQNFPTLLAWPLPGFGVIFLMAAFALIGARQKAQPIVFIFAGLSLAYMATLFPFYVTDRYRLPVIVFLLPLAGACTPIVKESIAKQDFCRLTTALFAAFIAALITFWPNGEALPDDAYDWGMLAAIEEEQGHHAVAIADFDKARQINPEKVPADAWIETSQALANLGRKQDSIELLQKAQRTFPDDGSISYNLGRQKFSDGDYDAALAYFQQSIRQLPTFTLSYRGVAAVYDHNGNPGLALEALRQGLTIVPNDPLLLEAREQIEQRISGKN